MTREELCVEQDAIAQRRHECILILDERHPEKSKAKGAERYRVLISRGAAGKTMTAADMKLVRFGTEFREAFESGLYCDQGFFDDLIAQAKREIRR